MSGTRVGARDLGAYSALAFPLAMAALPVYVHVPKLYGDERGLALTTVGLVLLFARALDALQDPLLGWWSDRVAARGGSRNGFLLAAVALLGAGVLGLFHPPAGSAALVTTWLAASLVVTYFGFSMGTINYFAFGAELSRDYHERTRVTAARGAVGVAGVLMAAALPDVLAAQGGLPEGLRHFSLLYVPILLAFAAVTLFGVRQPVRSPGGVGVPFSWTAMVAPLRDSRFRWLLAIFVASGVASAIPAALILFYVQDVLGRSDLSGLFLAIYFLFGAIGMPLWVKASRRIGKKGAWGLGMVMSVIAFVWAFLLGNQDATAFAIVCALSGIAYGAELALPPSLLADVADASESGAGEGVHFGFWQLTEKANLAVAAGVALPVLGLAGYQPGTPQAAMGNLSAMYALIPCLLKLGALAVLWVAPLDARSLPSRTHSGDASP